jgi:regulatory protein
MTGRRRGRTGRGWDAAPRQARRASDWSTVDADPGSGAPAPVHAGTGAQDREPEVWAGLPEEDDDAAQGWPEGATRERPTGRSFGNRRASTENPAGSNSGAAGETDPAERAREICLRLLAIRPRTRTELAGALRQRGIPADVAAEVLDRYDEVGIIDDRAFARAWVTSRHYGRGLARKALAGELRRKGVDNDAVGDALAELSQDTEAATARDLVERKLRTDRGGQPDALFRRLVGMLARKGYPAGLAVRVVKEALADRAAEVDGDLLEAELDAAEADAATAGPDSTVDG